MKKWFLLAAAVLLSVGSFAQTVEAFPSYIQVNGEAEREVAPNEIYLSITINERDSKGKISVEEQQRAMIAALKKEGVDIGKQLKMIDLSSAFFKKNTSVATARYQLKLGSAVEVAKAWQALDRLGISLVTVEKVAHSDIKQFEAEVRAEAIRSAKAKADELAAAIGQKAGKCFYIFDMSGGGAVVTYSSARKMARSSNADFDSLEEEVAAEGLEFQSIRLRYHVQAKFVLE